MEASTIDSKVWELLKNIIAKHLPDTEVWAFGSRIKGTASVYSDLDLVAFTDASKKNQFYDLVDAFSESDLPFRVDLLNWYDLPESFHKNIEQQHIVIIKP